MIIDAENIILGRLASFVAKKALRGNSLDIINCEKAVVSGKKRFTLNETVRKYNQGTFKGPFIPKQADRFVRRTIRGMLPYKTPHGREAFKKIKCYLGIPVQFNDKKSEKIPGADSSKLPSKDHIYVKEIIKKIGGKIE